MKLIHCVVLGLLLVVVEPAVALRCGGMLVNEGTPQSKVLKYCGEPTAVQVRSIYRSGLPRGRLSHGSARHGKLLHERELLVAYRSTVEVIVEEWTYNFGPHRFMRSIRFENGVVTTIQHLGYGYHDP